MLEDWKELHIVQVVISALSTVDRCWSMFGFECKHQYFISGAGSYRKLVDGAYQWGDVGEQLGA